MLQKCIDCIERPLCDGWLPADRRRSLWPRFVHCDQLAHHRGHSGLWSDSDPDLDSRSGRSGQASPGDAVLLHDNSVHAVPDSVLDRLLLSGGQPEPAAGVCRAGLVPGADRHQAAGAGRVPVLWVQLDRDRRPSVLRDC